MNSGNSVTAEPRPIYMRVFYILALASLIVYILMAGAALLKLITVSAFLAMLLTPLAGWLEKIRLGRFAGAVIPVLCVLFGFLFFTGLIVRQIISIGGSLEGAADRVGEYVERLNYFLSWHLNLEEPLLKDFDGEGVEEIVKNSSVKLLTFMGGLTGSFFKSLIVPPFTFFMLYYRRHLLKFSVRLLKHAPREDVKKNVEEARMVAQNYFFGMLKVVGILAILNSGALFLLGVKHAVFFAVFAAFLNIVPFFGPLAGSLLPILFTLVTRDSLFYPIAVAVAFIVIQLFESYFLTPRIIGRNVRINPLVVFISLFVGSMIWGVTGMILIIPVLSISMQLFRLDAKTEPFAYLLGIPPKEK